MKIAKNRRLLAAAALVLLLGGGIYYITTHFLEKLPETTEFKSGDFSFSYPRVYDAREYAAGVVSIGKINGEVLIPNVEVDEYKSDPDIATPTSFDAFMKRQAAALCGADGSVESISCTQVGVTPYVSSTGVSGKKLDLTLVRKNLKTGIASSTIYGPIYVFDTTASSTATTTAAAVPVRYSAVFIYPALSAFIDQGTTTPQLLEQIVSTFKVTD